MTRLAGYLVIFWTMQVAAYVAFKFGSQGEGGRSRRWLAGFIAGNIVGAASIYVLMKIFEMMPANPNLAAVLAGSGGFIGTQIALAVIFRARLGGVQWIGVAAVAAGMAMATLAGPL